MGFVLRSLHRQCHRMERQKVSDVQFLASHAFDNEKPATITGYVTALEILHFRLVTKVRISPGAMFQQSHAA